MNTFSFRSEQGMTLLEILITMVLVTGITFFVISFSKDVTDSSLRFTGSLVASQQIQQALQIILPELRSAATSNNGSYPIIQAASTSLTFFSDIDHDGVFERVRYFFQSDALKKGIIEPTGEPLVYTTSSEVVFDLITNLVVQEPIFTFYPENATSTESAPLPEPIDILSIRMISVTLFANQGSGADPVLVGGRNQATIRNLRYKQN